MKKLFLTVCLSLAMLLSFGLSAFAADADAATGLYEVTGKYDDAGNVTVTGELPAGTYHMVRILELKDDGNVLKGVAAGVVVGEDKKFETVINTGALETDSDTRYVIWVNQTSSCVAEGYVVFTEPEDPDDKPGNNYYGGGGGTSSSNVTIAKNVTGGKVTVSPSRPARGQLVTIHVTPADGYKLESLTVTDSKGNEIELTKVSDTKYTFTMPAGKVTVTPVFAKIDGSDKDQPSTNVSKRFSDVAADAWYAEYINYVAENGLMNGYEDGRFGPNDQTTRAQIVTVMYRMEGEPAVQNSSSFKDVSAGGQYYSSAVAWAARNNIVNGYEDGRFGPNDNVTREQIATILYRYAQYKGYDTTLAGNIASFSDAAKVSSWANTAIAWAVGEGLMNGDNGALRPQGNATRAEIAALLMRFCENIAK